MSERTSRVPPVIFVIKGMPVLDEGQYDHHDHGNHDDLNDHDHVAPVFDEGQGDHHDAPAHNAGKELCFRLAFLKHLHLVDDDDEDEDDDFDYDHTLKL